MTQRNIWAPLRLILGQDTARDLEDRGDKGVEVKSRKSYKIKKMKTKSWAGIFVVDV